MSVLIERSVLPPAEKAGYQETTVRFTITGEPKRCDNSGYIPTETEYAALREVFPWLISESHR